MAIKSLHNVAQPDFYQIIPLSFVYPKKNGRGSFPPKTSLRDVEHGSEAGTPDQMSKADMRSLILPHEKKAPMYLQQNYNWPWGPAKCKQLGRSDKKKGLPAVWVCRWAKIFCPTSSSSRQHCRSIGTLCSKTTNDIDCVIDWDKSSVIFEND